MYSRARAGQRLEQAAQTYNFTPIPHSVADVAAFEAHLIAGNRYVYDDLGHAIATQNLAPDEAQWIQNEQILVMCDAEYFLTRYCYLKNEENVIERFLFRVPQRIIFGILAELEAGSRTLELMFLKARQLGCSTLIELLIAHRIIFGYGVNAIIGSADQTKTMLMANMLFLCYDMLPPWMRPTPTRRVESDRGMLVFGQNLSGVSFQHGAQMSGIARGTTPTVYHLSEIASYTNAEDQIESSLFRCVHPSPNVFGVLESSGEGTEGWWPDTWNTSKKRWPRGLARLCPLFLPWFCGVEMYPHRHWITNDHPVPANWQPLPATRLHVAKCELYVRSNPLLRAQLIADQRARNVYRGGEWQMPHEQQWFWEFGHEEALEKGTESKWYQEMCADDEEAFQHSEESVFGRHTIEELQANRKRTYDCYTLSGQSIEDSHEVTPEFFDYSRERMPVRFTSPKGEVYRWEFIPLKSVDLREDKAADVDGVFLVFHPPQAGLSYSIGVDTSGGRGQDSTVISVWSVGSKGTPDVQCAEFSDTTVSHVEAFSFTLAIAAYYGRFMASGITRWPQPYVSIEQVEAVGDTCQHQMMKMGYRQFHKFVRLDQAGSRIAKQKGSRATKIGWYTHGWSRPILTDNFVHSAQNGWAEINSPWLIEEMRHFEAHSTRTGRPRYEHEEGEHDDRIFAAAMAIFCPHDMDVLADRSKKRPAAEPGSLPRLDYAAAAGGRVIAAADIKESLAETVDDVLYERW